MLIYRLLNDLKVEYMIITKLQHKLPLGYCLQAKNKVSERVTVRFFLVVLSATICRQLQSSLADEE